MSVKWDGLQADVESILKVYFLLSTPKYTDFILSLLVKTSFSQGTHWCFGRSKFSVASLVAHPLLPGKVAEEWKPFQQLGGATSWTLTSLV